MEVGPLLEPRSTPRPQWCMVVVRCQSSSRIKATTTQHVRWLDSVRQNRKYIGIVVYPNP